jgi:hypothetical protein
MLYTNDTRSRPWLVAGVGVIVAIAFVVVGVVGGFVGAYGLAALVVVVAAIFTLRTTTGVDIDTTTVAKRSVAGTKRFAPADLVLTPSGEDKPVFVLAKKGAERSVITVIQESDRDRLLAACAQAGIAIESSAASESHDAN